MGRPLRVVGIVAVSPLAALMLAACVAGCSSSAPSGSQTGGVAGTTSTGGDTEPSGSEEAYGVARAMTLKYTGPLFQIGLAKDKTKLLDIGQTADHKADMTTWSAFCSGNTSNCVVSKIYAQIHSGPNDLVPGVFKT